jgi:methylamine---glutamate N-methyltransferase subunit C
VTGNLGAAGFPEESVRARARRGAAQLFPEVDSYGRELLGAGCEPERVAGVAGDDLDRLRIVPPIFMPSRLEKLIDLGREPLYRDVDLETRIGGFDSPLPLYVSAFGSTRAAAGLGLAVSRQAGSLGIPMVIGENIAPTNGMRSEARDGAALLGRIHTYAEHARDGRGGVVVQQSTEDADAEVWNFVYSDPSCTQLADSGRLAFELKLGQGAKPGLGGMTVLGPEAAAAVADRFALDPLFGDERGHVLRSASPGTFTEEILRQQIRLMRNNFPRARVWVKLHPGRDVALAARVAWAAGADAVTVDGAEGGTGWAPLAFLDAVGLPLGECLSRIGGAGRPEGCLLASGRIWEGARAVKALALGARAAGLGRAAILAVDEDPERGLLRLAECLAVEISMLISALGRYAPGQLAPEDLWAPDGAGAPPVPQPEQAPRPYSAALG